MRRMLGISSIIGICIILLLATHYASPTPSPMHVSTTTSSTFTLTSPAFAEGGAIPARFTCDSGSALSPALSIAGVPAQAQSLALLMDDPDIPMHVKRPDFQEFDHWILFNVPPTTTTIAEGSSVGVPGVNSAGGTTYTAPCPPPQYEPREHRYIFTLYALDTLLDLPAGATKAQVHAAAEGHIIAQTQLVGRYQRQ